MTERAAAAPELWGGIECTLNRVGDRYYSQLALSGHLERPHDLEMIAGLGIRTLRYPVLWEMVAPGSLDDPDWSWTDQRLALLKSLGIDPVVGLVHHGSGPAYTGLLDPDFPAKLARYARLVAERYPWVKAFTPINEPLTTARFSALYGHWYPHATDDRAFVRALLHQCSGILQAMLAIRELIPEARLVLTEDLGSTASCPALSYQAEFENHRRWLSFDLLAGRVGRDHPLRGWLEGCGASEEELELFSRALAPADLIGVNYYLTSDRYLDDRLALYHPSAHGGNGRDRYVDVEAVRACPQGIVGHEELLRSAWQRYGKEVAVTEVHLGSSREEQLRWLHEAWCAAVKLRREGVAVRAVTAWALLGSFDWNSLFTRLAGHYEPGAFDVRGPQPRPTAIAAGLKEAAQGGGFNHPVTASPGWWRRPMRFLPQCRPEKAGEDGLTLSQQARPILVIGKSGTLGMAFGRLCEQRGLYCHLLSRSELDIAVEGAIAAALELYRPWAVINAAGYVRIDEAEEDWRSCFRENTFGPALLARQCALRGIALVTFSSDMVFDGTKGEAYGEGDRVCPVNVYGMTKATAEREVLRLYRRALVIRTSAFFGPWDDYNFVTITLRRLAGGEEVEAASDLVVSPTYLPDLVNNTLDLLLDGESGIWHMSNCGSLSWAELALSCAKMAGLDHRAIIPRPSTTFSFRAKRPPFSALVTTRGARLPDLDDALRRYFYDAPSVR